jgi:hypothetical protein
LIARKLRPDFAFGGYGEHPFGNSQLKQTSEHVVAPGEQKIARRRGSARIEAQRSAAAHCGHSACNQTGGGTATDHDTVVRLAHRELNNKRKPKGGTEDMKFARGARWAIQAGGTRRP